MKLVTIPKERVDAAAAAVGGDKQLSILLERTVRQIRNYRNGKSTHPFIADKVEQIIAEHQTVNQ